MDVPGLASGLEHRRRGWRAGLTPDPDYSVADWADRFLILSGKTASEPGHYRTARTPYLREILDALSPTSPIETVVMMKGNQIGWTQAILCWLGFTIDRAPGPALLVQPTVDLARRMSRQRIKPMIDDSPALRSKVAEAKSRDGGNTTFAKEFQGGMLVLTGSNSAAGLRSLPARYLALDEIDGYPRDVDGEGDPVELAKARTDTFKRNRKIVKGSTPTVRGISRIEADFQETDQRRYFVPCPKCGVFQLIEWDRIHWDKDEKGRHLFRTVHLECSDCKARISERYKRRMLEAGEWRPTAECDDPTVRGYHLSALYSPLGWYSWEEAARDFVAAKRAGAHRLKTFVNLKLAQTWEEEGVSLEPEGLIERAEQYDAEVPEGVLVLTIGVDVQDDRLETEIVGWGLHEESWGIDRRTLWGDPGMSEREPSSPWAALEALLSKTWTTKDGARLKVVAACVDSGGHYTQSVYAFVKGKAMRRVFATKGVTGETRPIVTSPARRKTGRERRHVELFTIGVDSAKTLIYSRLGLKDPGPGYCHFPIREGYGADFFTQLTAERREKKFVRGFPKYVWTKIPGRRNESLDCRVLAIAALFILNPVFEKLAAPKPVTPKAQAPADPFALAKATRGQRRRKGFVSDY